MCRGGLGRGRIANCSGKLRRPDHAGGVAFAPTIRLKSGYCAGQPERLAALPES